MKKLVAIATVLFSVLFTFFSIAFVALIAGADDPVLWGVGSVVALMAIESVSAAMGKTMLPNDIAYAGLNKEIWLKQLMELFYPEATFLTRSVDMTAFVDNNTINLADCGVDPKVYWNNDTYPIQMALRSDKPIAIPLDIADTQNTIIRNARRVETSYDQMEITLKQHRQSLFADCAKRALHAWAPSAAEADKSAIIRCSGATKADGSKVMKINDLIDAADFLDGINAPADGRVLVLNNKHKAYLRKEDVNLFKQFVSMPAGVPINLYGFDIYGSTITARYSEDGSKKAFGEAAATGDMASSLFYLETEVMRADGDVDMFERLKDPEERADIVGFQKRFIALPIRGKALGSIY